MSEGAPLFPPPLTTPPPPVMEDPIGDFDPSDWKDPVNTSQQVIFNLLSEPTLEQTKPKTKPKEMKENAAQTELTDMESHLRAENQRSNEKIGDLDFNLYEAESAQNILSEENQQLLKQIAKLKEDALVMKQNAAYEENERYKEHLLGETSQQGGQMSLDIGYTRTDTMNALSELKHLRTQTCIDQNKIADLEIEVTMLRAKAETRQKVAVEKAQLVPQLNELRDVQSRYQQLKKTSDEVNQRNAVLEASQRELEQNKRSLEAQLDAATKQLNSGTQSKEGILERYKKATAQLTDLETEGIKLSAKYTSARNLERKYWDERNKFEQEKRELEVFDATGPETQTARRKRPASLKVLRKPLPIRVPNGPSTE
uniref:Chromosome segregation protein SMC n=1 Tax=Globodera pallida TaxID=36090 RepID=A0A183CG65_GLOPA